LIVKHESTTHGIVHAGFSRLQAFMARKKSRSKLTDFRFESPHATIPKPLELNICYLNLLIFNNEVGNTFSPRFKRNKISTGGKILQIDTVITCTIL